MTLLLCLLGVVFVSPPAQASALPTDAGDSATVLILSNRVGPVIEAEEATYYSVFSQVKGLSEARAVVLPDSSTAVVFVLTRPGHPPVDSLVLYTETTLKMIAEKIDHFEGLLDGSYTMGTEPVTLQQSDYKIPLQGTERQHSLARAPFATPASQPTRTEIRAPTRTMALMGKSYPREKPYPKFAFSFGVQNYSPDTKGLEQTIGQGVSYGGLITVGVEVEISPQFGLRAEGGGTTQNDGRYACIGPVLYLPFSPNPNVRPFFGAGYASTSAKGGGNGLLMETGSRGFYLTAGLELILGTGAAFNAFGTYASFKVVRTTFQDIWANSIQNPGASPYDPANAPSVAASMKLSHIAVGIRLKLFF